MGAHVSDAMLKARELILGGATPYAAAKATGITQSAISKSKWNRERKQKAETQKQTPP